MNVIKTKAKEAGIPVEELQGSEFSWEIAGAGTKWRLDEPLDALGKGDKVLVVEDTVDLRSSMRVGKLDRLDRLLPFSSPD